MRLSTRACEGGREMLSQEVAYVVYNGISRINYQGDRDELREFLAQTVSNPCINGQLCKLCKQRHFYDSGQPQKRIPNDQPQAFGLYISRQKPPLPIVNSKVCALLALSFQFHLSI